MKLYGTNPVIGKVDTSYFGEDILNTKHPAYYMLTQMKYLITTGEVKILRLQESYYKTQFPIPEEPISIQRAFILEIQSQDILEKFNLIDLRGVVNIMEKEIFIGWCEKNTIIETDILNKFK